MAAQPPRELLYDPQRVTHPSRARQLPRTNGETIRLEPLLNVNGIPLVPIERKDPANTAADLIKAIDQVERSKRIAPDLFVPSLLIAVSDGPLMRVGNITSGRQRFTP
jgi:type I restriction enzyme R subunit